MAYCEECGARIPDDATVCPVCGAKVTPAAPAASFGGNMGKTVSGYVNGGGYTNSTPARTPDLILAENEKIVRQYQVANIKRPRCTGYLTVTNKRIIFSGMANTSRVAKEVVLDSVSGLDGYYGLNINAFTLVIAIILLIGSIYMFTTRYLTGMGVVVLLCALVLGVLSFSRSFFLAIFSSKAMGAPIALGSGVKSLIGNGALYTLTSAPTVDTDRMISELGALVQDLQTLGDHAIDKWK